MNQQVEELFHKLADMPSSERMRYFAEHLVDPETRQEVEALLAFDTGPTITIDDIGLAAERTLSQFEASGRRCGPYRLLRLIGRGGMGAVYLAERADGELTQRVAVKLLGFGALDPDRR